MHFSNPDQILHPHEPHARAAAAVAAALEAAGAETFSLPRMFRYLLLALCSVSWQVLRCAWQGRGARRRARHEPAPIGNDDSCAEAAEAENEQAPETELDQLRQALARNPRRGDIRLELARALYEAGEAQEFLKVALPLEEILHEESWERIRTMGYELLPGEYRFFPRVVEGEDGVPPEFAAAAELDELSQRRLSARALGGRR